MKEERTKENHEQEGAEEAQSVKECQEEEGAEEAQPAKECLEAQTSKESQGEEISEEAQPAEERSEKEAAGTDRRKKIILTAVFAAEVFLGVLLLISAVIYYRRTTQEEAVIPVTAEGDIEESLPSEETQESVQTESVKLPEKPNEREPQSWDELPVMGAVYAADTPYLVGIDPGHLGYTREKWFNTGAVSPAGTAEYEWTLKIALRLTDELRARGYNVYLLRTTDVLEEFPYDNGQRAEAANEMDCDILVAIHWDGSENKETTGYHTIYKGDRKSPSYRLAQAVSDAYGAAVEGNIEQYISPRARDDLWQLNEAEMPAIIVECGFSSNEEESAWLEDEANHAVIVKGIADGIDDYFIGERALQQKAESE